MTNIQTYPTAKTAIMSGTRVFAIVILLTINLITSKLAYAQEDPYEEFIVTINVPRIGSAEIPAIIHGQELFLPVKDLFDFLKIKNSTTQSLDSITGFFIDPMSSFVIDKSNSKIRYRNQSFDVQPSEFYRSETSLYIKSTYFGKVFGLDCKYDFRSLSVNLETKIELPAIREMQQELMRRNLSQLRGEKKADTVIKRKFSLLKIGTVDWAVNNFQKLGGDAVTRAELGLGAMIAGGEANLQLHYNSTTPFNGKQQLFRWRYVDNNNKVVRQITLGQIFTQSISTLDGTLNGIQVSNTPTSYRRSFGSYRLSDRTEPEWMVELYVNGVLVNYMKADASGFFNFDVPLVYGNSAIKLRFYSPWGEERTKEVNISIPFNFLPEKQFEYSLTGGIVNDEKKSKFTRARFYYGLNQNITLGGGVEYISSAPTGQPMPFLNASWRIGQRLMITGEHAYNVRTRGLLNFRMPANVQLEVNYTKFNATQTAVRFNYLEESRVTLSMPIRAKNFSAFSRLSINQYKHFKFKNTTAEFLFSSIFAGVSSNFTTYAEFNRQGNPLISTNASFTLRAPWKMRITPQALYEYKQKKFTVLRFEAEKNLFNHGFLNFSYQKDLVTNVGFTTLGFRYNFKFAQAAVTAMHSKYGTALNQAARGSIIVGKNSTAFNQQNGVGKGGAILLPFLDLNCNGVKDPNEPKAKGLNVRINGGRTENNKRDTTIRVVGLEAFNDYMIDLDKHSFENVAWQLRKKNIAFTAEPNHLKLIEVPISVVGEVSGHVHLKDSKGQRGQGRVIINILNEYDIIVAKTVSESDGYFSYLGLPPGNYTAEIDGNQLQKLKMSCSTGKAAFSIKPDIDGDVASGLEFVIVCYDINEMGRGETALK
jgi:hypothetical protein